MDLWPHQITGLAKFWQHYEAGQRRICLTAPPRAGKTVMMTEIIKKATSLGMKCCVYTNRVMLTEQMTKVFESQEVDHGLRASGFDPALLRDVQICSLQTDNVRVYKSQKWKLHEADLVIIDEAHSQRAETAIKILGDHTKRGACLLGFTATPVGIGHLYDVLIQAAKNSDLRACGAHLICETTGPDEQDLKGLRRTKSGEYNEDELNKRYLVPVIFGRVIQHWLRLNPLQKPTILFAPSVAGSVWFCDEFSKHGILAAHIDGVNIHMDGKTYSSDRKAREAVYEGSKCGEIKVVCNRFVLRESIDWAHLHVGIGATTFGALHTFLQAGSRILNSYPGYDKVIWQCHGGCLDSETEVLTERGWLGRLDIRDDDKVAGYNRETGEISWQSILHRHDRPLELGEQMFSAKGRSVDIRVTGNHRIVRKKRTCDANDKPCWPKVFSFEQADSLAHTGNRFSIPVAGLQKSRGLKLTDDEIRFIGWFMTDGSRNRTQVTIGQADHQPQIKDLRECLVGCGFDFREYHDKPSSNRFSTRPFTRFGVPKGTGKSRPRRGWAKLESYLDKSFSPLLEGLNRRQFGVLLHAIHLGDGAKHKYVERGSYAIATGNKLYADRLQALAVRRGYKCSISSKQGMKRVMYIIHLQKRAETTIHGYKSVGGQVRLKLCLSETGERVWCVANALETLVTRRNGRVAIIGNSWWRHGSLNDDREWSLSDTPQSISKKRKVQQEKGKVTEIRCPQCGRIRRRGLVCPGCGHEHKMSGRVVVQLDGTLKKMTGAAVKKKREPTEFDKLRKAWQGAYYSALNSKTGNKTMLQVLADYRHRVKEAGAMPYLGTAKLDRSVPDRNSGDWNMRVKEYAARRKAKKELVCRETQRPLIPMDAERSF